MPSLRSPGEPVLLRFVREKRISGVQPVTVLEDRPDRVALALVPGTRVLQPEHHREPEWGVNRAHAAVEAERRGPATLVTAEWTMSQLLLVMERERWYAIHHFWDAKSGRFLCWYVNFQLPFSRVPTGFDTRDLALDLIVGPDHRYGFKDEDEFATFIEHGRINAAEELAVRRAADEVVACVEERAFPFDGAWLDRRPSTCAPIRELPSDWDVVAGES